MSTAYPVKISNGVNEAVITKVGEHWLVKFNGQHDGEYFTRDYAFVRACTLVYDVVVHPEEDMSIEKIRPWKEGWE